MAMTLITTNTSSGAASSVFTSSIDSTYKLFIFKFYDVNPVTDDAHLQVNFSIDGGSNYNVAKTTTLFIAYNDEADSATNLVYQTGTDLAQGTGGQPIAPLIGNGGDESAAGELYLFNPSNTTYVKHYHSRVSYYDEDNRAYDVFTAGYFNTTTAIDDIQFKMSSGNFDGVIQMYGIS